jgi:hypothetical protein
VNSESHKKQADDPEDTLSYHFEGIDNNGQLLAVVVCAGAYELSTRPTREEHESTDTKKEPFCHTYEMEKRKGAANLVKANRAFSKGNLENRGNLT